jgi:hypothetical protein
MKVSGLLKYMKRNAFALGTVALFATLFIVAVANLLYESKVFTDEHMARDIEKLAQVFEAIDAQCYIVRFDHQKNYIDFLNVKNFSGTAVGSMSVMFPDKWKGPYFQDVPSVFGKPYLVVRTKKGYFITPPEGTRLSNGSVVGVDIPLDEKADFEALVKKTLNYKNKPLALRIKTTGVVGPMTQIMLPDVDG